MATGINIEGSNDRNHFGGMDPSMDAKGGKLRKFRNRSDITKERHMNQITNARARGEMVANGVEIIVVFFSGGEIMQALGLYASVI